MTRRVEPRTAAMDGARQVADAVLYEGYLLYPYRASAGKNQSRWQFGVLGPPGAAAPGVGEEPEMGAELLLRHGRRGPRSTVTLRFLQLQARLIEQARRLQAGSCRCRICASTGSAGFLGRGSRARGAGDDGVRLGTSRAGAVP